MAETVEETGPGRVNRKVVLIGAAMVTVAVLGVVAVLWFVAAERERDLQSWQIRLGIVADSRAAAVGGWIDEQFGTMRELAENASLQLYVTELALAGGDRGEVTDEPAQASYLRNLLVATADRAGFTAAIPDSNISANVERVGIAGLALADATGRVLVATPQMPPVTAKLREFLNQVPRGEPAFMDMHLGVTDEPTVGFVLPVFGIQADPGTSEIIGLVIGMKLVDEDLFARLEQPGEIEETAETYLVRQSKNGVNIEYLSPLSDGSKPLRRRMAKDTPDLAASFMIDNAGGFTTGRDFAGTEVLVTGRQLTSAPWTLVRKIAISEALAESDRRQTTMLVVFLLLIVGTSISMIAVWRHGSSIRAAAAAERHRIAAERFQNLGKFLRVVTDGQPAAMVAVDEETRYTFANASAAAGTGIEPEEMLGKSMASVIGPTRAKIFQEANKPVFTEHEEILQEQRRVSDIYTFDDEQGRQVLRATHIPLRGDRDHPRGVLMILDDITDLVKEREHSEATFQQLVNTLMSLIARADPFSAHQAARVAEVGAAIAREMSLSDREVRTVEVAGQLMNLGKTLVPPELLTRTEALTDEELERIRDAVLTSAELLEGVDFQNPLQDTIRQCQEHWDGSGRPQGLAGTNLIPSARILAVANAFVGMTSARAYRAAMPIDEAESRLMSEAGTVYDRGPVSALVSHLENHGGREVWAHFGEPPEEVNPEG